MATQTLYMQSAGAVGGWWAYANGFGGLLLPTTGAAQKSTNIVFTIGTTPSSAGALLTPPLAGGTIVSGTWTIGMGGTIPETTYTGDAFIALINGSTGAIRQTIIPLQRLGAAAHTASSEVTFYGSFPGVGSVAITAGDWLQVEIGVTNTASGMSASLYFNGTTAINSDNIAISSASSAIVLPSPVQFQGGGTRRRVW